MSGIREVPYNETGVAVLGIETLSVSELKQLAGLECLKDIQRIQFYLLLLFAEGQGEHMVDFVTYPVQPNTLMLVRPGQVQQFHLHPNLTGQLIVVEPAFLMPEQIAPGGFPALAWWSPCTPLPDDLASRFFSIAADIDADSHRYAAHPARRNLLQHELYALLLLLRLHTQNSPAFAAPGNASSIVAQFKQMAEEEYAAHRPISFYAERLGCAEKTLSRACLAVERRSAKVLLDERILLESKRLLIHREASVADIAQRLGFSETTNFIRFFKKHQRLTPIAFRDQHIPSQ